MLAELAAANAAFAVIKTAIQNGREISDVAHKVGEYVNATETLRKKGEKKKRKGSPDLEEFMHLEKLKQQEDELKQWMIYAGRPGLWHDWQRFQAQARKDRLAAIEQQQRRRRQILEVVGYSTLFIFVGGAVVGLILWVMYLRSL